MGKVRLLHNSSFPLIVTQPLKIWSHWAWAARQIQVVSEVLRFSPLAIRHLSLRPADFAEVGWLGRLGGFLSHGGYPRAGWRKNGKAYLNIFKWMIWGNNHHVRKHPIGRKFEVLIMLEAWFLFLLFFLCTQFREWHAAQFPASVGKENDFGNFWKQQAVWILLSNEISNRWVGYSGLASSKTSTLSCCHKPSESVLWFGSLQLSI